MVLRLGEVPTLVVSSREAACEVMKTHDRKFATRPLSATMRVLTNGGRDLAFAPYGEYWRQLRKIAVTELFTARRVLSFRAVRAEEVAAMLGGIAETAAAKRPVEMRARLSSFIFDSTVRAVMGDRFEEREGFLRALDRSVKLAAGFNPPDLWPSSRLAGWISGAVRCAKECRGMGNDTLDAIIQDHLERMEEEGHAEDLLDVLLRIQKEGTMEFHLDTDAIQSVIFEIFGAGSETATTTLEWAVAELIKNPKVMHKATAEVRRVMEARRTVAEDALGELHYLRLVVRETLRLHPPLPLLLPRECQEPCQVLGYDVPRGMQVLVNAWALGRDDHYWNTPDEFRPERFQGEAAAVDDFRGMDFAFLPFGAGRRMCPGMAFALANIELPLAGLLLHFDWEGPPPEELDMSEEFGLTARRKGDLLLLPVLRLPVPAA
ncbi:hypothetical protein QYE76_000059 [Lolium multiflorum]|uniref:Cytochrome P450 71D7 n=1 Tax=Lolium multiflorum TaxID=4521 RepID=A0AAD8Q9Z0_LOLMU|nr:hypothetical protein QYE76_000059 [Lolium multiflorum]